MTDDNDKISNRAEVSSHADDDIPKPIVNVATPLLYIRAGERLLLERWRTNFAQGEKSDESKQD